MMTKRMVFAVLISVLGVAQLSAQQATATGTLLRWKFVDGAKFGVEVKQEMRQRSVVGDQDVSVQNDVTTTMSWVVNGIDEDGLATIGQTIHRVQMHMEGPQGQVDYDSQNEEHAPSAEQIAGIFDAMVGVEVQLTMNDRGEILDVVYPAEALEGMRSNPTAAQFVSPDAMREMTTKASPILPEGPAVVGQTWSKGGTSKTALGAVSIKNTYSYEGKSPEDPALDLINVVMEMGFELDQSPLAAKIDIKEQDNKGTLTFDSAKGYLNSSEINQNMTMAIEAAGQNFEQKINSSTMMTVTPAS